MENENDESMNLTCTPPILQEIANNAICNLLPQKSAAVYERAYEAFISWSKINNVKNYTENVYLAYFHEKAKTRKSSTLWSLYSMLKSTFNIKHNIDISKFTKLVAYIKQQSAGYKPKKSHIFTREDIQQFLIQAPDQNCLMWKVKTINSFL